MKWFARAYWIGKGEKVNGIKLTTKSLTGSQPNATVNKILKYIFNLQVKGQITENIFFIIPKDFLLQPSATSKN